MQIALPLFQNYSVSTCIILESYNYVSMRKVNHIMFVHVIRGNSIATVKRIVGIKISSSQGHGAISSDIKHSILEKSLLRIRKYMNLTSRRK